MTSGGYFTRSTIIKWTISIILSLSMFAIPLGNFFTSQVRLFFIITIFGLALAAFELLPEIAIGALMPALWIIFDVAPTNVVMSPWLGTVMYMTIGMLLLAATCSDSGLLKRISFMVMSVVGNNYWALIFGVFFAGVLLSFITFGACGHIILGTLCFGLCKSLNIMDTKMSAAIAMSVMLGCCSSHCFLYVAPAYGVINAMAADILTEYHINISMIGILAHNWPMLLVCIFSVFVLGKIFKTDMQIETKKYFQQSLKAMGPMSKAEKANLAILLIITIYLLTQPLHKLDANLAFCIFPWLLFFPFIGGAEMKSIHHVNWSMIIFIAGCMSIGTVASSFGFGDLIAEYITPIFITAEGNMFKIFGTLFGTVFALNFLMTPTAIWALITAPMAQLATTVGINPQTFLYALVSSAEAVVLPYEYVPYLIIYSFGMIKMSDFVKISIIRCIILFVGFLILQVPYWKLIGLLFI